MKEKSAIAPAYHLPVIMTLCASLVLTSCRPSATHVTPAETLSLQGSWPVSLLGDTLRAIAEDDAVYAQKLGKLDEAHAQYLADSTQLENIIWYARRLAYLHRYRDAIAVLNAGEKLHPHAPELYRHRGHRYITLREFDAAINDLRRAAQLAQNLPPTPEPDGIPNKLDIPLSNLHFNIYYHLGLALYLKGAYADATQAWTRCMEFSVNPDLVVATSAWLYLSCMRSGDTASAKKLLEPLHPDMEIIENDGYLQNLMVYKGIAVPLSFADTLSDKLTAVTQAYGVSCWHDLHGRHGEASTLRRQIIASNQWPAFGYIAAEADSSRRIQKQPM